MSDIEQRVASIEERNRRVEADKAWEVSWTRRLSIAALTYLTSLLFLWLIDIEHFALSALVPTGGYMLSTLSLPWIRRWWIG